MFIFVGVLSDPIDEDLLVLALSLGVAHHVLDAGWSAPFLLVSRPV